MAQILFKGDAALTATTNNVIDGIIPDAAISYINLHAVGTNGRATITGINPHIGDHEDIAYLDNHPIEVGDVVQLHSDDETYDLSVTSVDRPGGTIDGTLDRVEDPFVVEDNHSSASETGATIRFTFAADSEGTLPTTNLTDDEIISFDIVAVGTGDNQFVRENSDDNTSFGGAGLTSITYETSSRTFILTYASTGEATTGGTEITAHGGSDFDIIVTYHDGDAITALSFTKPLQVGARNATQYSFPISLPFTTSEYISSFSCGEGTKAILINNL